MTEDALYTNPDIFSDNIKKVIEDIGYSLTYVAEQTGISRSTLNNIVNKQRDDAWPSLGTAVKLCKFFNIDLHAAATGEGDLYGRYKVQHAYKIEWRPIFLQAIELTKELLNEMELEVNFDTDMESPHWDVVDVLFDLGVNIHIEEDRDMEYKDIDKDFVFKKLMAS